LCDLSYHSGRSPLNLSQIDATLRLHQHDAAATREIAELQLGAFGVCVFVVFVWICLVLYNPHSPTLPTLPTHPHPHSHPPTSPVHHVDSTHTHPHSPTPTRPPTHPHSHSHHSTSLPPTPTQPAPPPRPSCSTSAISARAPISTLRPHNAVCSTRRSARRPANRRSRRSGCEKMRGEMEGAGGKGGKRWRKGGEAVEKGRGSGGEREGK
jgi:hypothetical protein